VFDLPSLTITGTDGRSRDVVVELSEAVVEQIIPVEGPVRQVQVNRDSAALADPTSARLPFWALGLGLGP
jgi:hypothetical protein